MALTDKLTAIANAIRSKTGETGEMTLDQMPIKIGEIETGAAAGVDLSRVTATENDVIAEKKFYLRDGTLATGTIQVRGINDITMGPDAERVDIPDGYYPERISYYFPEPYYQFLHVSVNLSDITMIKEIFNSMKTLAENRSPVGMPVYPFLIASADTKNPMGAWCTYYYDAGQSQGFIVGCATIDGETLFEIKISGTYSGDTCDNASVDYIKYGGQSIIDSFTSAIFGCFL